MMSSNVKQQHFRFMLVVRALCVIMILHWMSLSLSHWYPGSGVVLDCIDSRSLHAY